jgi:hypothetical protein
VERLARVLPTGVFSNEEVDVQLEKLFSRSGRTNDFRKLKNRLTLVATNLDSGEACPIWSPWLGPYSHLARRAGQFCFAGPVSASRD